MRRIGAPTDRHLRRAKLPTQVYDDAEAAVPEVFAWAFAGNVARSEGIEDLGRVAAKVMPAWESEPGLVHLLQTSPTLWAGLSTFCRLAEHVSNIAPFAIERVGDHALFRREKRSGVPGEDQAELYAVEILMQLVRLAAGREWLPRELLVGGENARRLSRCEELDGVRIQHNDTMSGIVFPAELLASPMDALSAELAMPLPDRLAGDLIGSLRAAIGSYLSDGRPDIRLAAEMSGLSERTLQRRLGSAGLSFRTLLDQVRLERAKSMLADADAPITDIAYDLGFSDAAHFTRAFRRWTAVSPREYRRRFRVT